MHESFLAKTNQKQRLNFKQIQKSITYHLHQQSLKKLYKHHTIQQSAQMKFIMNY